MGPRTRFLIDMFVLLLIVGTGAAGALQLSGEFSNPVTPLQWVVPWSELAYVVGAAAVLLGWRRRAAWTFPASFLWGAGCIGAAVFATWGYGNAPPLSVAAAGAATLAVVAPVVLWVRRRTDERRRLEG